MSSRIFRSTGCVFRSRSHVGSAEPPATVLEDESRFGNNGAFTSAGNPDWVQLPSGLWVMSLDGSDDVTISDHSSLNATKITIIIWLKTTSKSGDVITKWTTHPQRSYGSWVHSDGTFRFYARETGDTTATLTSDTDITATDSWYCMGMTSDGANLNLYLNGASDATAVPFAYDLHVSTADVIIGKLNFIGWYNGLIGGVRIYNRALSASEIAAYYQATRHWFGV